MHLDSIDTRVERAIDIIRELAEAQVQLSLCIAMRGQLAFDKAKLSLKSRTASRRIARLTIWISRIVRRMDTKTVNNNYATSGAHTVDFAGRAA